MAAEPARPAAPCASDAAPSSRQRTRRCCSGVARDVADRLPLYLDDWRCGVGDPKALSATLYIFFTNVLPAVAFSLLLSVRTGGQLGAVEVVLSMGIGGVLFALFAGQPLVIVGVTGPVTIFCYTLCDVCTALGVPFLGALFYTSAWAACMHAALAATNACDFFPRYVTAFSGDSFGCLICVIYVYSGCAEFASIFGSAPLDAALLSLLLGLSCLWLASQLDKARTWPLLTPALRGAVADYGQTAAILATTLLQFVPGLVPVPRLQVPSRPMLPRPWLDVAAIAGVPAWAAVACCVPALILTALLYFDHNISSLLSQRPEFHLRKPPAFNLDFLLLGLSVFLTGVLGLPPNYGLIPQAPLHVRALATVTATSDIAAVCETRVSALGQSLLILALLSPPLLAALGAIPQGVLAGLFLHLGLSGLLGNALVARLCFLLAGRADRDALRAAHGWARGPVAGIAVFTLLQVAIVGAIFAITLTQGGIVFPVVVVLLVPLRLVLFPQLFDAAQLERLDPRHEWGAAALAAAGGIGAAPPEEMCLSPVPGGSAEAADVLLQAPPEAERRRASAVD